MHRGGGGADVCTLHKLVKARGHGGCKQVFGGGAVLFEEGDNVCDRGEAGVLLSLDSQGALKIVSAVPLGHAE